MREFRHRPRFACDAIAKHHVVEPAAQQLDRELALELRVEAREHHAHATLADSLDEQESSDARRQDRLAEHAAMHDRAYARDIGIVDAGQHGADAVRRQALDGPMAVGRIGPRDGWWPIAAEPYTVAARGGLTRPRAAPSPRPRSRPTSSAAAPRNRRSRPSQRGGSPSRGT